MVPGVPKRGTRCPEQNIGRVPVSNGFGTTAETFNNTIPIPLAIAGSRLIVCSRRLSRFFKNDSDDSRVPD